MKKEAKIVIGGDKAFAEIAYEYFTHDSPYEVAGFAVEARYLKRDRLFDLPVVALEKMEERFPPASHRFFAAVLYAEQNAVRARLAAAAKKKGYELASYVSSRAFVWRNVSIGEHCFVFEHNVIQPFATLGENVVLWSGNHIGHHSAIGDHTFVSSHVVVSGFARVGARCFFGVNATVSDNLTVGDECTIGANALVLGDVPAGTKVLGVWKKP